jgi:hypothetical protein
MRGEGRGEGGREEGRKSTYTLPRVPTLWVGGRERVNVDSMFLLASSYVSPSVCDSVSN